MNQEVFAAVADALERGEPAALVTIVSTTGSTPQRVGAKMLVFADGRIVGTIGGGCYENDAFWKAREAITHRRPQLVHYELSDDFAQETGLICGGQMDVYIEPIEPSPELYVIGAGHVGFHLARLAHEVGFRVHVVDDREKFANRERFPDADEDRRRRHSRLDRRARRCRRTPTSSSSPADTPTISRRCARWRRAICAIWASSAAAPRSRASTTRSIADGMPAEHPEAGARADRPRHRRRHAAGDRRQHPGRADRRQARQDQGRDAAELSMQWNNLE